MEHGEVWPNSSKEGFLQIRLAKGYSSLPAGVDTRSCIKEVDSGFVRV